MHLSNSIYWNLLFPFRYQNDIISFQKSNKSYRIYKHITINPIHSNVELFKFLYILYVHCIVHFFDVDCTSTCCNVYRFSIYIPWNVVQYIPVPSVTTVSWHTFQHCLFFSLLILYWHWPFLVHCHVSHVLYR
jgi:hypothetical protein